MRLLRIPEPFDHSDWIFEPKMDGFRALGHVKGHHCTLISRKGHTFKSWPQLAAEVAHSVRAHSAILDGEICCLNPDGTSNFKDLLFRREWPCLHRVDVLTVAGEDIRLLR
jgi:ATP-dependent DNA ligase